MPNGFFRTDEGVREYQKIGKEYPNTLTDEDYIKFQKRTANSPHSGRNKKEITRMIRELADDGNEYLIWDMREIKYTPLGAEDEFYCPGLGKYPIPITRPQIVFGDNMQTQEVVSGNVVRDDVGYSMPFTKENADELHKFALDYKQQGRTRYVIRRVGGRRISVSNYEDFRDGNFDELEKYGTLEEKVTLDISAKNKITQKR